MTKTELRQICLTRQKELSPDERSEKSSRIALHFFECIDLSKIRRLHCFIPIEKFNEVDTSPITRSLWTNLPEVQIIAPRVNFEIAELESLIYSIETKLVENAWGIREPAGGELVEPATIDMVIVPGLAFDRSCHRVGYGKGFYDRFLKRCRPDCIKIGLSYFDLTAEISDIHQGDMTLDFCVTPDGIFTSDTQRKKEIWPQIYADKQG